MWHKKGLEMAIGMIVLLILSVLIFSLSVYFVFQWFGEADALKVEIDKQTQEQIVASLKTGNNLVAIPIALQNVGRGQAVNFGMGVRNVASDKTFSAALSFSGAYDPRGNPIPVDEEMMEYNWLGNFNVISDFYLRRNEQKLVPLQLKAHTSIADGIPTPKGDYVFNVCVYDTGLVQEQAPAPCKVGPGVYFDNFYTGRMYQVTIRVI